MTASSPHAADTNDKPTVDRQAAFAAGTPRMSRTVILWALAAVLALGLGGTLLEHVFSGAGLNPVSTATTAPRTATGGGPPTTQTPLPAQSPGPLGASLSSSMGLVRLRPVPAPAFSLVDQAGRTLSLGALRPDVVVLTFFDGRCDDICPVLADELHQADADLGAAAAHVAFLTVNTDPAALATSSLSDAASNAELATLPNWHILTGPLDQLNAVWRAYGVAITYTPTTGLVTHSDVMDFIAPDGTLRFRATPYADESTERSFSLPAASVTRWAQGIATYAAALEARQ